MIFLSLLRRLGARRRPAASPTQVASSVVVLPSSHAELRETPESGASALRERKIPAAPFAQRAGRYVAMGAAILLPGVARAATYAHADGQVTAFGTGVNNAQGTAIDASGNVYIANIDGSVFKEVFNSTTNTYTQSTLTLSPALTAANGLAVDTSGNLYLSTGASDTVVKYTGSGTSYTAAKTFSGFTGPVTATVDGSGNVYIADAGAEKLYKSVDTSGTYGTLTSIASGFSKPSFLAVNTAGTTVYVSDNGNTAIYAVTGSGTTYTKSTLTIGGSTLDHVQGIAVDALGDLYIQGGSSVFEAALSGSTYTASAVYPYLGQSLALDASGNLYLGAYNQTSETKLTASPSFNSMAVATAATEIPVTFTIDTSFTLGTPTVTTQGQPGYDFTIDTGTGTTCTSGTTIAANTTCTVYVAFTPTAPGLRLGAVNLYNGSTLVATTLISGVGTGPLALFQPGVLNFTYTTGLKLGRGLALDPAGDVFLSDQSAGTVLRFTKNSTSATTLFSNSNTNTSGLCAAPSGVAVDGAGDVFFGCESPDKLYEIVGGVAGSTPVVIDSNIQVDDNLSVDGAGNLYTTEEGGGSNGISGTIYKYAAGTFARTTLYAPATNGTRRFIGMALDANGNLFAVDFVGSQIYELPAGTTGSLTQLTTNSGLSQPHALGVDPAGNIYVGLYTNATLYRFAVGNYTATPATLTAQSGQAIAIDNKTGTIYSVVGSTTLLSYSRIINPTLSFASTAVGSTNATATNPSTSTNDNPVVLENDGNATLLFPIPASGTDISVASNFAFGSSTTCPELTVSSTSPGSLSPGASCAAYYVFTPTQAGAISGQASAIDNSLNATGSTQRVTLTGTGTAETPTVAVTSVATPYGSTSTSLSAQVTYGGVQPTGSVTFTVDSGASVVVLDTACTVTSGSEICTASYNTAALAIGSSHTIKAVLASDGNYNTASNTATLTVTQGAPLITGNSPSALAGSNVTLTATITYTGAAAPSGAVSFQVAGGSLVTATNCTASGGTETCSVSYPTTGLTTGAAITVKVAGDTNYATTSVNTGTVTVLPSNYTAPTEPTGTTSATQTATLVFPNGAALGALNVLTQGISGLDYKFVSGGTCAVGTAYTAGQSCTVLYTFTPASPGPRYGAITLYDNSTTPVLLGMVYLNGIGTGPLVGFAGGVQTTITSSLGGGAAGNIAIDAAGNLYIADFSNNRILKETVSGTSYTESVLGTGLDEPNGIAVDGAGNLYIANQASSVVMEEVLQNGTYTQRTLLSSGLDAPVAIAVDGTGSLYIANLNNKLVLKETPSGGTYTASTVATLTEPSGVAVDGNGVVYIVDQSTNIAYTATPSGSTYTVANLVTGLKAPFSINVDGGGNVYIGDSDNNRMLKETLSNGTYTQSTVGTGLDFDQGVVTDARGNIYIVDSGNNRVVKIDVADAPALAFGSVVSGSSSAAASDTLQNNGNASLALSNLATTTTNFALSGSTCSTSTPVVAGGTCTVGAKFTPQTTGALSGTLNITDNNLSAAGAVQPIALTGTGTYPVPAVTGVSPANGPSAGGTSVTITGTGFIGATVVKFGAVSATSFTVNSATSITAVDPAGTPATTVNVTVTTPGGSTAVIAADQFAYNPLTAQTITFPQPATPVVNGTAPVTLTASASSGLPVTYTVTGPATLSGSTLTYTGAGTVTVTASQAGNTTYAAATPVIDTVTVTAAATSYIAPTTPVSTTSATQTATLTFTAAGTINGIFVGGDGYTNLEFTLVSGGSCVSGATVTAGSACTVNYTFTPNAIGTRLGSIVAGNSQTSRVFATTYLSGIGTGSMAAFVNATPSVVLTGLGGPQFLSADDDGYLYLTSSSNATVYRVSGSSKTTLYSGSGTFVATAIDGLGNLYVSDKANARILELNEGGTLLSTITLTGTNAPQPNAIVVGADGTLYVADPANNQILSISPAGVQSTVSVPGYPFTAYGLAIDTAGTLYIPDYTNNRILKLTSTGVASVVTVTGTAIVHPNGLSVDAAGDIFVAESGSTLLRISAAGVSSAITPSGLSPAVSYPVGVLADGKGDVFMTDQNSGALYQLNLLATPGITYTPSVTVGASSATKTAGVFNAGNTNLTFSAIASASSNFTLDPASTTCSVSSAVASGQSCLVGAKFTPQSVGTLTGNLNLTDNTLNVSANLQQVPLSGTATGAIPTVSVSPVSAPYGTATVNLSATVSFLSGYAPTGAFTFTLNGATVTATCTAATSTTETCTYANFPIGTLAGGTYAITGTLAAAGDYTSASDATHSLVITAVAGATVTVAPSAVVSGGTATLSVTVAGTGVTPTGSVTFTIGSSTTTATCTLVAGTCSTTYATTGLATGATITGTYNGNANYTVATGTNILTIVSGSFTALTEPVGTTSPTQTATLVFNTATTLNSSLATAIQVVTQGVTGLDYAYLSGSTATTACLAGKSYTAGQSCTVTYSFTPAAPGNRLGAILLENNATNPAQVAVAYLNGTGTGPLVKFTNGVRVTVSPLNSPRGVQADAAGNVYVNDNDNNGSLLKFNAAGVSSTLSTGLGNLQGIAVDGAGDIYYGVNGQLNGVGTNGVYELVGGLAPAVQITATAPDMTLAVDGSGNLYVPVANTGQILEFAAGTHAQSTFLAAGAQGRVAGITLDAAGDLLFGEITNNKIDEVVAGSSTYTTLVAATDQPNPDGIAVDAAGNLYVTFYGGDNGVRRYAAETYAESTTNTNGNISITLDGNGTLYSNGTANLFRYNRTTGTALNFPKTAVGAASTAQSTGVENDGNTPLTFSGLATSVPDFKVDATTTTCSLSSTLPAAGTCNVGAKFTPQTVNSSISGTFNLTDDALNTPGTTQQVTLTGASTFGTATVTMPGVAVPTGAIASLGVTVTGGGVTPTGIVSFTVGTTTVSCTLVGGTCSAPFNAAGLPAGPVNVILAYLGDNNYSPQPGTGTLTVGLGTAVVAVTNIAAVPGGSATLIAAITGNGQPPAGTVSFTVGTGASIQATCSTTGVVETCTAPYPTTGLTSATTAQITASFGNDPNYAAGTGTGTLTLVAGSFSAGSLPVGTPSATLSSTVVFTTGGTLSGLNILTQGATGLDYTFVSGGSCAAGIAYTAGQSCTVEYTFTPLAPGTRLGAITVTDSTGAVLGSSFLTGTGTGSLAVMYPGTQTAVITGLGDAFELAADASNNLYVGDFGDSTVYKETLSGGVYTQTTLGSGFANPGGIAVDGQGNVFIADQGNGRIVEELLNAASGAYTQTVPFTSGNSGLGNPFAVAVDSTGTVYLGDGSRLLKEIPAGSGYSQTVLDTGFGNLTGLAVDSNGDLFLADNSGSVFEETLSNGAYTRNTIATGLTNSNGVFVDASGTLYVTASGSSVLRFVPNATGGYVQGATVGGGFGRPNGVTLDSLGNVYVADDPNGGTVYKVDLADNLSLNLGATTPVGGTGAAQTSTLTNIGNQPLNLSALALSDSTDFSLAGSTCTATGTVASAASCAITVAFTPQSVGTLTGTATSTDNSLNKTGATQTINLNATSVQATPGIAVLSGNVAYGTAVEKLSATVTFTAGIVPTGAFTFTVGMGQPLTAACGPLTSTTESCSVILTTSGLSAGVYPVVGTLASDANYATLSGTGSLTVTQITPTVTVAPVSILYGATPTTLNVQVAYAGAVPTGSLTVQVDGGSTLPATCSGTGSPLVCTVSYPTGTLTAASHTVTATLAADTNYASSTGTGSLVVSATGAAVTVANAQVNAGTPTTTLRATVAFSGATPTGAFTFSVDNAVAIPATCTAVTSNSESCIVAYTTSAFSVGTHTIKGVLAADSNYTTTPGQATLTVISVTPVVSVAAPTFAYGAANTTFTATVTYAASAVPTGTFTFQVDNGAMVNATCVGTGSPLTCTGNYPTAAITAGTHTLTGTIGADSTYVSAFNTAVLTVGKTTPTLSVAKPSVSYGTHTVMLSATVAFTGAAPTGAVTFTVDGGTALAATCTGSASPETCTASFSTSTLSTGAHTVSATSAADTNYNATSGSNTLTVTSAAPTLSVASPSVLYGAASANLSATLAFTGVAPTGNITFQVDNGAVVKATCTGSASPLTCTAAYTTSTLTTGSHTVTASVAGDTNYSAASATGTLTVNVATPTITAASPSAIYGASSVNLSATVTFPGAVPAGAFTFSVDNGTPVAALCSGTGSPRTCSVSYPLKSLAAGTHTVTASLAADNNYSAASGTGTLTLTSTAPTVLVASSSAAYGTASTTLSATVTFAGTALPTGALTFTVDNGTAAAATCTGIGSPLTCTATYPTATLNAGAHTVTASFAGDSNYSPATGSGTLTVTAVSPTLTFTVPNHTFGDAPFTVSATSTGTGAFTYSVVSGPATVSGSTVTLTGAGTVVLGATQAASTDYSGSSKQATFTVAQASAVVSVSASATQVNPLQSVTLTAAVASTTGATPSGSVTFYDNGVAIGTVPLVQGVSSLPTTTLAAGTVNVISVSYSGDGNFLPATSGAGVTVTVGPLDFTFLLSGDHGFTAVPGTAASYNFALTPVYGTYAGTVSFSVTGLPSGATATFSPSSVPVSGGPQPIIMSVLVPQSTASNVPHGPFERTLPLLALLLLPTLGNRRVRRTLGTRVLTLLLLVAGLGGAALLTGCGATKGNGFELQEPHTYTLTVTATSGALEHSQTVTLTVQ